jgi:hypothetical protein
MKFLSSKIIATALLATGVVTGGMVAPASAGQSGTTCNVLDVTGAIDCYGSIGGNDSGAHAAGVIERFETDTKITSSISLGAFEWEWEEQVNNYFTLTNNGNTGTIEFTQDIDFTFALNLKAAKFWSAYFFDGAKAGDTIDYVTDGVAQNNKGNAAALSHASLFISDNAVSSTPDTPDPQEVPEPGSILGLLAVGAMGTGALLKRKQR